MNEKDLKYKILVVLSVVIVIAFDVFFVSEKEGYHMDEILSYELSNSEFTPWITPTQPEGRLEKYYRNEIYNSSFPVLVSNLFGQVSDVVKRRSASTAAGYTADVYDTPQWMSSEDITEYVTYYRKDSVIALSAYYNSTTDNHPPLYFMLLNIVSAIYSLIAFGKLSVWPGCILNMIFMAGSLIVINLFFRDVAGKRYLGPPAALLYGLSPAGINTVVLIRMYSMTAFWCLAFTYLILKRFTEGDDFRRKNKALIAVTVLGYLTQYFVCIYFFFLTGCLAVYLICKKKKKTLKNIIKAMVISGVWGIALYPFVFHDLFGTKIGDSVIENLSGFSGFSEKLKAFTVLMAEGTLWSVYSALFVLLVVLFAGAAAIAKHRMRAWAPMLCVSAAGYLLTVSKIAPYTVDRYLMPVFPIVSICIVLGVGYAITFLAETFIRSDMAEKNVKVLSYLAALIVIIGLAFTVNPGYLFSGYLAQERLSERYSGYDAIAVYDGTGFYRNVPELMNYRNCLLLKEDETSVFDERIDSLDSVVLIEGIGVDRDEVIKTYGEMYGFSSLTILMEDGVHGDRVCLLSK